MVTPRPKLLSNTERLLRLLVGLNLVYGLLIATLLAISVSSPSWLIMALGFGDAGGPVVLSAMRIIMVIGLAGAFLGHYVLRHLGSIVRSVRAGSPFVTDNTRRLQAIAWLILVMQVLHLGVGAAKASAASAAGSFDINWSFSPSGWLAVLLLFVLATVFNRGAAMHDELQDTV